MFRVIGCALMLCVMGPDFPCDAATPEDDVKLLERHGLDTDGLGLKKSVFFNELVLSEDQFTQVVEAMVRLKTIQEIRFNKTPLFPVFTRELPKLGDVVGLSFSGVDLDATTVRAASQLKRLRGISITNCRLTGDIVSELSRCNNLGSIFLVGCGELEGDVFSPFVPLKNLYFLVIRDSPKVSDEGLAALRHYEAIETLMLDGTSVTDEVFVVTESIGTLKHLSVTETKVTEAATNIFRANHPDVKVFPRGE
jgi:hypothetical protein